MTTSSLPPSEPQQPTGAPGPGAFGSRQQQQQQQQNRPREPKRVRNGVRLDIEEIPPGTTERSAAWIRLFSAEVEPHIIEQGMEYARKGQTISLTLVPGHVRARIQGTHTRPYSVELAFPLMSDDVWNRLISVLAEQSRLIAQILSGRLPSRVDRLVQTFGTPLMPERIDQIERSCTCREVRVFPTSAPAPPDRPAPICKHMIAVALLVAQELERNPLVACTLRGMEGAHLVERLRLHRSTALTGARVESVPPLDPPEAHEAVEPLEAHLEDFWALSDEIDTLANQPERPAVAHTLLRRLGPSPMSNQSKFPIAGLLATCYDLVTEHILEMQQEAMGAEEEEEGEEGEVE